MIIKATPKDVPKEVLAEVELLSESLKELNPDMLINVFARMVDMTSKSPTIDLNIGINIILKSLRYFSKSKAGRLDILKQVLEGLMEAAKLEMDNDFK